MAHFLDGTSILVTGGTGSFGQAFARHVLSSTKVGRLIIFSRDEWKQWEMRESDPLFRQPNVRYFLGDVRDEKRLKLALQDVHYVVHAAALKQVPAAEYNPTEFIKTNIEGAMNLTTAAMECGVEKVVGLSSDKAVNPINLYGATKLCSDKLLIAANSYVGKKGFPKFSVVRYGNVLGSRGSLLPFWKSLVEKGKKALPITEKAMTRFWLTLDQSVDFVLMALQEQHGGEIFVPKCPSVHITDLAAILYPNMPLEVVGVRPGEKIHEILISQDDAKNTYEFATHYRIAPAFPFHKREDLEKALKGSLGPVADTFSLASNTNPQFLSRKDDIKKLLESFL
jgi:UDP-N-acetylglucosamine 4,6-dehydratase